MFPTIPTGYRIATNPDDILKLHVANKLRSLCRCGHLDTEHVGHDHAGACLTCNCHRFTWVSWLLAVPVKTPSKPAE